MLAQAGQSIFTGFSRFHTVPFELQQRFQRLADAGFIIDDQN
jgi:DNA-binding MurR/RpiR family transcriptional regulator